MKSISNIGKKRGRGRPATDATPVLVRLQPAQLKAIDAWAAKQEPPATRPEAIRGMIDAMLHILPKDMGQKPVGKPGRASRAAELAASAIDKIGDPAAHPEEHAQRRRRLTKGPEEFREVRVDRPKAKGSPK